MNKVSVLVFAVLLSISIQAFGNAEDKAEEKLPQTLERAVDRIISNLNEDDKLTVKSTPFNDLIQYHHGLGTGIRNSFGLWGRNKELTVSICGSEECHPDDAAMEIIYGVWNKLNGNDIRYKPNVEQP